MFGDLSHEFPGETHTPFAGKIGGDWVEGTVSIEFLQANFGHLSTATEMIAATESEGLKLFFDWLANEGKIPR